MDLGRELITYERRFGHAWGAQVVLMIVGLCFALAFMVMPPVLPVVGVAVFAGIGWRAFKTFARGRVKLVVFEQGFRWEAHATQLEAPWTSLHDVRFNRANVVTASGASLSQNMGLSAQLSSGEEFDLLTREAAGRAAIEHFVARSLPHLETHLAALERAGKPAPYGDLTLDEEALTYRKKRFPWARIAGYRLDQGHLMVDVNPEAPRMAFKVSVGGISSLVPLLERLEEKLPRGDYAKFPLDPSLFSLLHTTAATHDPRYLSRGQRLAVLASPLALVPLFLVYALISIPFALRHRDAMIAFSSAEAKFAAAITAHLESMPPLEVPLSEACAGVDLKLPGKDVQVRVGPDKPKLGFLTAEKQRFITVIDNDRPSWRPNHMGLGWAMYELLGDPPWSWGRTANRVAQKQLDEPFTAVTRVRAHTPPGSDDSSRKPGELTLDVAFIARNGKVLCEGSVVTTYPRDLSTYERADKLWEQGVVASSFLPVCERLGAGFCAQAQQFVTEGALPVAKAPPKKKSPARRR